MGVTPSGKPNKASWQLEASNVCVTMELLTGFSSGDDDVGVLIWGRVNFAVIETFILDDVKSCVMF